VTLNQYQSAARRTSRFSIDDTPRENSLMAALGLSGEVGELNDHLKKVFFHGHPVNRGLAEKELGDILWYVAEMCSALGFNLELVAQRNIEKLLQRYPGGFTSERSINRTD
jgi:NTP pyrophosphatase (non-canonical NTP hydrolase)